MLRSIVLSLFIVLFPLTALSLDNMDEDGTNEIMPIIGPPNLYTVIVTFIYDDAGNIIRKIYPNRALAGMQNDEDIEQLALVDEYDVAIEADQSWEHISVSVNTLDIDTSALYVYNVAGIKYFSGKINNAGTTINLSELPNGMYLFHITIENQSKTYKLIKR